MELPGIARLIMFIILLSACAPAVRNPSPAVFSQKLTLAQVVKEYVIQAGDQLDIKFYYNTDLNEQVTVRPDGHISLQLIQEVVAAGLTPAQLTELLTKAYSNELQNPKITVIVRTFNSHKVFVDGEVNKAGIVALTSPMTVLQIISQAGGLKDSAKPSEVIVIRRGADYKPVTMVVNLESAINGMDMSQDINLLPYDIVYVPKSAVGNLNTWLDLYIRKNIPVPIGMGYAF